MDKLIEILAGELKLRPEHVQAVVSLLDEGNTVPFIARYRKEQHGTMDDQTIRTLAERMQYLRGLQQRREEVKSAIDGGAGRRHRFRRHPGRGGGPLPPLPAQTPHPGQHCPGEGPGTAGSDAAHRGG